MDKTATAMPVYSETHRYVNGCTCSPMAVIRASMQAKPTSSVLTRRGRQRSKDMYGSSIAGEENGCWMLKTDVGCWILDVGCRGRRFACHIWHCSVSGWEL